MRPASHNRRPARDYARSFVLPFLLGIFPALFHYANNSDIALVSALVRLLAGFAGLSVVIYVVCLLTLDAPPVRAALAASVFLVAFHTYGIVANWLLAIDLIRVEHYTLVPLYLLLSLQAARLAPRLGMKTANELWRSGVLILGALLVFNLAKLAYVEIRTGPAPAVADGASPVDGPPVGADKPDIYYFVYDEMAGFEAVRQYWKYPEVDALPQFLLSKGFYVAERSYAAYPETLYELAQRFNYTAYPAYDRNKKGQYQADAANGRALGYLKSLGYTTVGFDENRSPFGFPAGPAMAMDLLYEDAPTGQPTANIGAWDGFSLLVLDNTLLNPLVAGVKLSSPLADANRHKAMIAFTLHEFFRLDEVPAPRFVYVHLLLPHVPHMFKPDGSLGTPAGYFDWDNYLDNYKFTIPRIEQSVEDILAAADPARPPVIIIQSDHGARNIDNGLGTMPAYPEEYKSLIVNAMLLPGCDAAPLSQDMNPTNTFPIVFNCYFGADIPLLPPKTPQ